MKSKKLTSNNRSGLAVMDEDKRRQVAKREGSTFRAEEKLIHEEIPAVTNARGFAAMDQEKRKEIARRGGSVARRNRIARQEPLVLL